MTLAEKKLWLLVAKETGSNLEARMVYDEIIKKIDMLEETTILSLVETENGIEVKISEKAYGNIAVVGLIEKIKMTLLLEPETSVISKGHQKYDA